jgi:hypothetical protein
MARGRIPAAHERPGVSSSDTETLSPCGARWSAGRRQGRGPRHADGCCHPLALRAWRAPQDNPLARTACFGRAAPPGAPPESSQRLPPRGPAPALPQASLRRAARNGGSHVTVSVTNVNVKVTTRASSLRGAKRRSNPDLTALGPGQRLDCFASLAMTAVSPRSWKNRPRPGLRHGLR